MNSELLIIIVSIFLIAYNYIFFPFAVYFCSYFKNKLTINKIKNHLYNPSVAIICAMYNEEDVVENKIVNFYSLKYPNIKFYIGSDGSTDRTNEIILPHSVNKNIIFKSFVRRGKVFVINDLINIADEDILVFTDANTIFNNDAINKLVKSFIDPQIGAVCGNLLLLDTNGNTGESLYWKLEKILKKAESAFDCVIGANGGFYAVRRSLVKSLPNSTINDDFVMSMRVLQSGFGLSFCENAIASEFVGKNDFIEFKRHVRDATGHYLAIFHLFPLLNPLRFKIFLFYVSHKLLRWFVPHLMLLIFFISLLNSDNINILTILTFQFCFYFLALIGFIFKSKFFIFYFPFYFCLINLALLIGFFKVVFGLHQAMWDRTERI